MTRIANIEAARLTLDDASTVNLEFDRQANETLVMITRLGEDGEHFVLRGTSDLDNAVAAVRNHLALNRLGRGTAMLRAANPSTGSSAGHARRAASL